MINDLIEYLKNKKILILGFGREGVSTYRFIRKYLNEQLIYIADQKKEIFEELKDDKNAIYIGGEKYLENLENYDIIIKAPGISFLGMDICKYKNKIKSQLELLLKFFNNTTIGITGTKGKSTTSSLIYNVLKEQNIKTMILGNIGKPIFDYIDTIEEDMVLVLEISSHQLEYISASPNISILLNVYEEHLDHYGTFDKYVEAKCNIYRYQQDTDYLIYNYDNETLRKLILNPNSKSIKVSFNGLDGSDIYIRNGNICIDNKNIYDINEKRNIVGNYNLNNIMFVLGVANILNLDMNKAKKTINEFKTLEHRLEFVGKYNDILFYDNSIGTVPMATIEAVEALGNVDTLIIGGMDRGIDYTDFINYLNNSKINNIVCMPKTGHDIAKSLKTEKIHIVQNMEEAVEISKNITQKNKVCLLSPTAASYGFFKNFEERGNIFKELVRKA